MDTTLPVNEQGTGSPEEDRSDEFVTLKVIGQDSVEVNFKVRRTTKLGKLKKSYCDRVGKPVTELRFMFDGARIGDTDTPIQLQMEDADIIEAYQQQLGGVKK